MYTIVKHIVTVASFLVQLKNWYRQLCTQDIIGHLSAFSVELGVIYGKSISEVESICVAHVESSTSYLFNMGYYFLVYFDGYLL